MTCPARMRSWFFLLSFIWAFALSCKSVCTSFRVFLTLIHHQRLWNELCAVHNHLPDTEWVRIATMHCRVLYLIIIKKSVYISLCFGYWSVVYVDIVGGKKRKLILMVLVRMHTWFCIFFKKKNYIYNVERKQHSVFATNAH